MNWMSWSVLSALFAGMTAVFAKSGVSGVDSNLATAVRTSVILVITWAVAATFSNLSSITTFSKRTWMFLAFSGVTAALSWLCYFKAMQLGEASRVASVDKLSVVFAIALAAIFLREQLTWQLCIGGTLIVLGALVISSQ